MRWRHCLARYFPHKMEATHAPGEARRWSAMRIAAKCVRLSDFHRCVCRNQIVVAMESSNDGLLRGLPDGIIAAMLPSLLIVTWLVWRAPLNNSDL
jgi:hypothetical protein